LIIDTLALFERFSLSFAAVFAEAFAAYFAADISFAVPLRRR
jgi:hypothetical protein